MRANGTCMFGGSLESISFFLSLDMCTCLSKTHTHTHTHTQVAFAVVLTSSRDVRGRSVSIAAPAVSFR
jgi:hypothetical protein